MDKILKPERFSINSEQTNSNRAWTHWLKTFENFISDSKVEDEDKKLKILTNFLSYNIYELIDECETYSSAIVKLNEIYTPKKNEVYSRYLLANRKQRKEETVDQYLQELRLLSKACNFRAVDGCTYRDESIRDAFISGILDSHIRQRLLEKTTLNMNETIEISRSLESAQKSSAAYGLPHLPQPSQPQCNASPSATAEHDDECPDSAPTQTSAAVPRNSQQKCYFCGGRRHLSRNDCPAKDATCSGCKKRGHFFKVCRSTKAQGKTVSTSSSVTSTITCSVASKGLSKAVVPGKINKVPVEILIDTGSTDSFVNSALVECNGFHIFPEQRQVSMASTALKSSIKGCIKVDLELGNHEYEKVKLLVIDNLCTNVLIGHDIMKLHSAVNLEFGGEKDPLSVCNVACASVEPPSLFHNLTSGCKPIATKSRRHSDDDEKFINSEVKKLLQGGIIEESSSPWRAQVLVTKSSSHKKRLVIDYSQTINKYTWLDAYPLPNIEQIASKIAENTVFSTIDLKDAYHQIPISEHEKPFTAFEAAGKLYQFCRVPFGVTNGVSAFQRTIDKIISNEKLEGVWAFIDDITVAGKSQSEHDERLNKFLNAAKKYKLTLNTEKSKFSLDTISILGYRISHGTMQADPERLQPLLDLPLPTNQSQLKRALGIFSHYSKWVPNYSNKIRPLIDCKTFPILPYSMSALAFDEIKQDIARSILTVIDDKTTLVVETDASDVAIAATLSQGGRPVAFFSKTLSDCEKRHPSIEKEALAIVQSLKKWRHFLIGRHFILITDQKALSFMFNSRHTSKIKNEKIARWRLELSPFSFDIQYRPGKDNVTADAFSRVWCGSVTEDNKLFALHESLCHPGITRMYHWVRSKNLPYSLNDVKTMTNDCPICAEIKPRFFKNEKAHLIKATKPFERLNIDFKGPLPSNSRNHFLLTIIDEYSRFPFAYACSDMTSSTVIRCFDNLFSIFGMPNYIHSDRGTSFLSKELRDYLHDRGIATSQTTPYNPEGNGQVEKFNGTLWKAILLALKSRGLRVQQWEVVLNDALHSIRSLLCTSTNSTPHDRFFIHPRRSLNGTSLPAWLLQPGPVFLKRNVRSSKFEPLVDEVELISSNPHYALVKHSDGRTSTVSLKQLSPRGDKGLLETDRRVPLQENQSLNESLDPDAKEPDQMNPDAKEPDQMNQSLNESLHLNQNQMNQSEPALGRNAVQYNQTQSVPNSSCTPDLSGAPGPNGSGAEERPTRHRRPPNYLKDYVR